MSNTRYFEFWQRANKYVEHRGVACDLSAIHQESWHKKFLLENVWMVINLKTCKEFRGQGKLQSQSHILCKKINKI